MSCGGESDIPTEPPGNSGGGEGGDGSGEAGSGAGKATPSDGGTDGEAGETGTVTGGKNSKGGAPGTGGIGQAGEDGTGGIAAGAPNGGRGGTVSVTGGVPGTGGSEPMAGAGGADGCAIVGQYQDTYSCQVQKQCPQDYYNAYCSNSGADTWYCECSSNFAYTNYEISGLVGAAACSAVVDVCDDGNSPIFDGEPVCTPSYESRNATYCEIQERCVQSVEISDTVTATLTSNDYVSCGNDGAGGLNCSCQGKGTQFRITGQDGTEACDTMKGICKEDPDVVFDGEPVCQREFQSGGAGYCEIQDRCTIAVDLGDGVAAVSDQYRYVNCQSQGVNGGGSVCSCSSNQSSLSFRTDASTVDVGTCGRYAEACAAYSGPEDIELSGPIECARSYQSATAAYCDAQLECLQDGTLSGEAIVAIGGISVNCNANGGAWTCSCNSGIDQATLSVDATEGWDACTAAVEQCPDLIEVQIGVGGGIGVPIPFDL